MSAVPSADVGEPADLGRRDLVVLGLAALVVRAVLLGALARSEPLTRVPISDAAYFRAWAEALAAGEPWREGLAHWLAPLYPWWLAALARVGLELPLGAVLVQGLVGVLVTLGVARLCARLAGRRAGLAAGILWLGYGPVVLLESRLLAVNLALPLALVALGGLCAARERLLGGRVAWPAAAVAGIAGGLSVLAHPNLLIALPMAALAAAVGARGESGGRRARLAAVLALVLGFAVGLAPGPISNVAASGRFVLTTANGGVNFGLANRPGASGTFDAPGPQWGSIYHQRDVAMAEASAALGRPVDEAEASRYWFRRGLDWIAAEPLDAARLLGAKLLASLNSEELDVQVVQSASRAAAPVLWLAPLPFGLLAALAALGVGRVRQRWVLLAWIAAGLVATALYFHYPRFRLVWMLGLMPFAGAGAAQVVGAIRGGPRPRPVAALLAACLLGLSLVPAGRQLAQRQGAHARVDQGLAWMALGRADHARAAFEDALQLHPGEVRARVELAKFERSEGRREAARARLLEALALPVDYPPAVLELVYLELGSPDPAERRRGHARAQVWLDAAPKEHPQRREFEIAVVTGLLDRARQAGDPEGARGAIAEARARLEAMGPRDRKVRDVRELLWEELGRREAP
ncbi:MAG: tetratricopeptide repeat protein [Planctomycetaceae bacterium]|nr:tetratricopeptide repeat protein [Planctomycetaceae bacterium]